MSAGGLSLARIERLRERMGDYVTHGDPPGLVWLVARRGEVYADYAGAMRQEAGAAPIQRDTLFRISSMTKPVTAVATMILVEEAKLRWGRCR
jgi:CubicO group peptidase (beta-lactamase class C family)